MDRLSIDEASALFGRLPPERQIATLSPAYAQADAARDAGLDPLFVGCETPSGVWLHSVHRSPVPGREGRFDLQSPYGYGGPVSTVSDPAVLASLWSRYTRWCADHGILAEFVRFHPLAPAGHAYGGRVFQDRLCVAIPVQTADLRAAYETRCRTAVRKAEKNGVTVREAPRAAISGQFPDFYRQGMRMIGAADFYLFADRYFEALSDIRPLRLLVAEKDGEWLAAALFFTAAKIWEYHLSAATPEGRRLCAANLLIDVAAHQAREAGADFLFLGGGTDSSPDNPLFFFKAGFSANTCPFMIGGHAHLQSEYDAIKATFPEGPQKRRILFYRN